MLKIKRKWTSFSFQTKIAGVTLILFVIFCLASTYSWYKNFTKQATETAVDNISSLMETLSHNFELTLKDIDYVTALISNKVTTNINGCVIDYLLTQESDSATLIKNRHKVQDYLSSMCSFKSYLQGMGIYDFNGRTVSFGITTPASEIKDQPWFDMVKKGDYDILFVPPHTYARKMNLPEKSQVFSIIRPILYKGKAIGFVSADIKSELLDDMFNINNINGYTIYLVDNATGEIIYKPEKAAGIKEENGKIKTDGKEDYYFKKIKGKENLLVYESSSFTPWTVVGSVPESVIISGFVAVRNKMLFLVVIYGGVFILLALAASRYVTKDLRRLSEGVASIDRENMMLDLPIESMDEVGFLYRQIQSMLGRIRNLIVNIKATEKEKRTSEIRMLQSQINPHFLYNTLNTIKILASMQGITNIQTVCNALSDMLHLNLDIRKYISVQEETEYLMNYLQIQEYRYSGKFTYHFSVEEGVKNCKIPKLMIQPIVENALQHGIAPLKTAGILQVLAYQEGGHLKVLVKDNGIGFDKELLEENRYNGKESNHMGVSNIYARLKLLFGDDGDLQIFCEPGLYTITEMTMPIIYDGEESAYD